MRRKRTYILLITAVSVLTAIYLWPEEYANSARIRSNSASAKQSPEETQSPVPDTRKSVSSGPQSASDNVQAPAHKDDNLDPTERLGVSLFQFLQDHPNKQTSNLMSRLLQHLNVCAESQVPSERFKDRFGSSWDSATVSIYSLDEQVYQIDFREIAETCDGYSDSMKDVVLEWITNAADEGDGWAQYLYLGYAGPYSWDWRLDPEKLVVYSGRINDYYLRAISGNLSPDSLAFLSLVHTNGYVGDPDPILGLAYDFARLMYQGDSLDEYWQRGGYRMTEEQIEAAHLLALELYEECCANYADTP